MKCSTKVSMLACCTIFDDDALEGVEARCRLKAKAASWAATRKRQIQEGVDFREEIQPEDRKLIAEGKNLGCFLWMNHPSHSPPANLTLLDDLSECYANVAAALCVVRRLIPRKHNHTFVEALGLLAQAQRALWVAIEIVDGPCDDDQRAVYKWLKGVTRQYKVFVPEMAGNDSPPFDGLVPAARIAELDRRLQRTAEREKQQQRRLRAAQYHVDLVASGAGSDHDCNRIIQEVNALVAEGVPPSNVEVRELLLPVVNVLPSVTPAPHFQLVVREINQFRGSTRPKTGTARKASPEVGKLAKLLRGRTVVVIGGDRRHETVARLAAQLHVEFVWVETNEHDTYKAFRAVVARREVAVVLLLIRWASHSFGKVEDYCRQYGKPLVRLAGGYSLNQMAYQVLQQCGDRLAANV